jgi:hypothetical protein
MQQQVQAVILTNSGGNGASFYVMTGSITTIRGRIPCLYGGMVVAKYRGTGGNEA